MEDVEEGQQRMGMVEEGQGQNRIGGSQEVKALQGQMSWSQSITLRIRVTWKKLFEKV